MTKLELQFHKSLKLASCPPEFDVLVSALWYDRRGDWGTAHDLINDLTGTDAARVHAYLHRKEGDLVNADYWYRKAGQSRPGCSLENEWTSLVKLSCSQKS